jgi:hypothetical protein
MKPAEHQALRIASPREADNPNCDDFNTAKFDDCSLWIIPEWDGQADPAVTAARLRPNPVMVIMTAR